MHYAEYKLEKWNRARLEYKWGGFSVTDLHGSARVTGSREQQFLQGQPDTRYTHSRTKLSGVYQDANETVSFCLGPE